MNPAWRAYLVNELRRAYHDAISATTERPLGSVEARHAVECSLNNDFLGAYTQAVAALEQCGGEPQPWGALVVFAAQLVTDEAPGRSPEDLAALVEDRRARASV